MSSLRFTIVAPAGFATDPAAVDRAEALLARLGHRVRSDATARSRWQRFSAPDTERLAALDRVAHDDTDVALMLRGGYGFTRLLDRIDFPALAQRRTRWMGHSDFTAFQLAALARAGIVTYAGPMASYDFGAPVPSSYTLQNCFGVLEHDEWSVECALEGPSRVACAGTLWGGNLAMVAHVVGTPYLPDVEGGILFLEDVGEHPYRVERMLHQLLHAGILARQRAILLGAFTDFALGANDAGYDLDAAIAQLRARVGVPIYTGLPFGHVPEKLTLPVGGQCAFEAIDGIARLRLSHYRP
jgi:muramoyltetrapeptide carboxypeptidase